MDYKMDTNGLHKNDMKFFCEKCLHGSNNKRDFVRHLSSTKHLKSYKMDASECTKIPAGSSVINGDPDDYLLPKFSKGINSKKIPAGSSVINDDPNIPSLLYVSKPLSFKKSKKSPEHFQCHCGKKYIYRQGLYKHQKSCEKEKMDKIIPIEESSSQMVTKSIVNDSDVGNLKELVVLLLKENKEIQKNFVDLIPHIQGNNTNSHNTITNNTTNNNQFNINMFLNEHCKNAMNLTDFIDSLPITHETYDHTIENGLTKTITTMITDGLNNMDILERPIHCTDPSRKTMYVKDNDVWEKDTEFNKILLSIRTIALKQRTMINKWQLANQDWTTDENLQTKLTSLVFNSMTDIENDQKECNKIIRAISKNTYLTSQIKDVYK
jgi:hypothetical protein